MATVEIARPERAAHAPSRTRLRWGLAVAGLMLVGLGLRLWGIKQGLPYAYNIDENAHFVPRAIGFFGHTLNPFYFVNPPGYTNLLYLVFGVWFGGGDATARAYATDPTEVYVVARVVSAVLGTLAIWWTYLAGAKLFSDRRIGLLGAALITVAFLPVFYAHLALNDSPTRAPASTATDAGGTSSWPAPPRAPPWRRSTRRRSSSSRSASPPTSAGATTAGRFPTRGASASSAATAGRSTSSRPAPSCSSAWPGRRRSPASSSPARTRCWTSRASAAGSSTRPAPRAAKASSARRSPTATCTTSGRSPGGSAGRRRSPDWRGRSRSRARAAVPSGCSCPRSSSTCCSWAARRAGSVAG